MNYKFIIINIFLFFFVLIPLSVSADCSGGSQASGEFCNPLGDGMTEQLLIGQVINTVLGVVGSLALVMFIYGGLTWMTAQGNNEKIQKGKDILMWAALGLVVIFSAYAMVRFILEALNINS
jgi:hypothetical protein